MGRRVAFGALGALAIVVTSVSPAAAGTLGGEPPDLPNPSSAVYTATLGSGTVTGTLGPTPDDPQDHFQIEIPANLAVTSISYAGPDGAHNTLGCGHDGGGAPNVTFDPPQSSCVINVILSTDFMTAAIPWTVTVVTEAATVVDTTPPTLNLPAPVVTEATSPGGATVTYPAATATDDTDPTPTVACSPASNSLFAIGTTTVNCTATDDTGNVDSGSFTVTVEDTTDPTLSVPADQTAEATSPGGATVTYPAATATDIADATPAVSCSPASNSLFAIGTTTVNCSATDDTGNSDAGSFTVTVQDTTDPTLSVPADQTAEATSAAGADVTYPAATATDIADATPAVLCTPASGSPFPLGATAVSCTASDDAGNSDAGSFTVTVQDTTDPALVLADQQFSATGPSGALVNYTASATDAVDDTPTVECSPPSATTFPLGATTVSCTASDDAGNSASGTFTVSVLDEGLPLLQLPADETVEATGPAGPVVDFDVTASDDVDPSPDVSCTPASGSTFTLGVTDVSCTATDADGNESDGGFSITVVDTTGPVLDLPDTIDVQATGPDGAVVTYEASANDAVAASVPVTCTPPSGSLFPVGTTSVTCTASDGGAVPVGVFGQTRRITQVDPGNETTGTFDVVVQAPPVPTTSTGPSSTAPGSTSPSSTSPGSASPSTTAVVADLPGTGVASGPTAGAAAAVVALGGLLMLAGSTLRLRRRS